VLAKQDQVIVGRVLQLITAILVDLVKLNKEPGDIVDFFLDLENF
jgi:hypothetical protein